MKALSRRSFTAAGILAALGLTGCFDPSSNRPEAVYGPPEDFEPSDNSEEDVYGPPEDFNPSSSETAAVYSPPSTASAGNMSDALVGDGFGPDVTASTFFGQLPTSGLSG